MQFLQGNWDDNEKRIDVVALREFKRNLLGLIPYTKKREDTLANIYVLRDEIVADIETSKEAGKKLATWLKSYAENVGCDCFIGCVPWF